MRILAVAIAVAASAGGAQIARGADAPFRADIEKLAERNADFRRVLFTGPNLKLYTIYAPQQPHHTRADAERSEKK